MSVACKRRIAVPFLNGGKQLHSLTIQLVHHNYEATVKRAPDSIKRKQGALRKKGCR
jgi:hypothetical protein